AITSFFNELVIAPSFEKPALECFSKKPNLRVLELPAMAQKSVSSMDYKFIEGGLLVQEKDRLLAEEFRLVAGSPVSDAQKESLLFAFSVAMHAKSNAIVLAQGTKTVGLGMGQVSRINAVRQAIEQAGGKARGAVLASDAFFPFTDSIELAANADISAIISPGGSLKDQEVMDACNRYGISMVFTGTRHFRH
ncbi:MAG: bifunctional phosphoribosylaminoimidazolecarboxamide formyltransferase/IMP cyclohydrolase, partial [Candidatus Diapherotrites archaeon]|nr:bifunctional phosphoribosylaminoimidazolecarboxamide formyltransferase/IMP cyclohydrolase [Candidatus Diapherotrites archaeon]